MSTPFKEFESYLDLRSGSSGNAHSRSGTRRRMLGQRLHFNARLGNCGMMPEDVYCARCDMENRIKEQQLMLFADRMSCQDFQANRSRLFLSSCAYLLMETLCRKTLAGTSMATAQCDTIRLKLFKVAAVVKESAHRILFSLSSFCPVQAIWALVCERLRLLLPVPSD